MNMKLKTIEMITSNAERGDIGCTDIYLSDLLCVGKCTLALKQIKTTDKAPACIILAIFSVVFSTFLLFFV